MSGRPREFKNTDVIDAAIEVFWKHGYEATSAEALCKQTGIGRGSLYNAFGSKYELYKAALKRYQDLGIEEQKALLERSDRPVKERLRSLMEWAMQLDKLDTKDADRQGCMAVNAAAERGGHDAAVADLINDHVRFLEQTICHLIVLGQRSGEIPATRSPLELTRMFISSYYGLRVLGKVANDQDLLLDIIEGTLSSLSTTKA
ncbi:TetR/AcrR family transcriptional regulator [Pseudalkalibacillus sp. A8]|uniref:TetR/AcrR family transcriptional regulator n=1 Tax=Pseudalkalibacillus sp. A8 TaxID=3382641 RepID=UPI0038B51C8A